MCILYTLPTVSYCSVIHVGVRNYILITIIHDFPHFIQCSEQIKIEYFCTVCSVKVLSKSVLFGLPG